MFTTLLNRSVRFTREFGTGGNPYAEVQNKTGTVVAVHVEDVDVYLTVAMHETGRMLIRPVYDWTLLPLSETGPKAQ